MGWRQWLEAFMADEVVPGGSSVDTSGFVDHLRLVHFTVCLTCFVAIIAIASQSVSSASRAYDQTNLLLRLADKWRNGEWLDEFIGRYGLANARFEALVEVQGRPAETIVFVPPRDSLPLRTDRDNLLGMDQRSWLGLASKNGGGFTLLDKADRIAGFKTVADAETIWNTLNEFRYVLKPFQARDGWLVEHNDNSVREVKLINGAAVPIAKPGGELGSKSGEQPKKTEWSASWVPRNYIPDDFAHFSQNFSGAISKLVQSDRADAYFVYVDWAFPGGVYRAWVLRADDTTEMVDLEARLGESIVPADFPPGDFNHSFPDVSELAKNLKTLSLAELQTFFQAEKDKTGDKIEFPLVKLPAESFAYWGTATIFLLAVYWFAVFRDFRFRVTPGDKAWSAAWIGISREFWSKCLFIATTLVPPSAAAYIIFFGTNRQLAWSPRAAVTAAVFLTVALPIAGIVYSWIRIQRIGGTLPLTDSR
jgi:hypothetical protein